MFIHSIPFKRFFSLVLKSLFFKSKFYHVNLMMCEELNNKWCNNAYRLYLKNNTALYENENFIIQNATLYKNKTTGMCT